MIAVHVPASARGGERWLVRTGAAEGKDSKSAHATNPKIVHGYPLDHWRTEERTGFSSILLVGTV